MENEKAMSDMIRKMNGYDEVKMVDREIVELKDMIHSLEVEVSVLRNELNESKEMIHSLSVEIKLLK